MENTRGDAHLLFNNALRLLDQLPEVVMSAPGHGGNRTIPA